MAPARPGEAPEAAPMQIHPDTARSMGCRGPPDGLYDAFGLISPTALRYLRGAWMVAGGDPVVFAGLSSRGQAQGDA